MIFAVIAFGAAALAHADTLDTEDLLLNLDESAPGYAAVLERLDELRRSPLDLNTCAVDDLLELPFISAAEAAAIAEHRRDVGWFEEKRNLADVVGLHPATVERLMPFVTIHAPANAPDRPRLHIDLLQRFTRRIELADGFRRDSSGYLGSPNVLQTRAGVRLGKFSARTTLDKDAGEPMRWAERKHALGYDFLSGHVQAVDLGWIRRLLLGDFTPRFGHGVLIRSSAIRRSAAQAGRGGAASLRPYASATESGHFRGIGIELAPAGHLAITAFASRRRIDASIDTTAGDAATVVSRRSNGLHRTASERSGRGVLHESSIGGALSSVLGPISLSAAFLASEDTPVGAHEEAGPRLRRRVQAFSLSAGGTFGALYAAAEYAPAAGLTAAIELQSGRYSRIGAALRRSFGGTYLPTSSLATGSRGMTNDVTEIAVHGRHRLSGKTRLDYLFEHALLRAPDGRRPFATVRSAADVVVSHGILPWLTLTVRGTARRSDESAECAGIRCLAPSMRQTLRAKIDYMHSRRLECRLRAEYVRHAPHEGDAHRTNQARGSLIYEELRIRPSDDLLISARFALYATDPNARVYAYESDLMYAFASPSFSGRGRRSYLLLKWTPTKALAIEAKWSRTDQADVLSMGSGRDKIDGGRISEVRMQLRLRLL